MQNSNLPFSLSTTRKNICTQDNYFKLLLNKFSSESCISYKINLIKARDKKSD